MASYTSPSYVSAIEANQRFVILLFIYYHSAALFWLHVLIAFLFCPRTHFLSCLLLEVSLNLYILSLILLTLLLLFSCLFSLEDVRSINKSMAARSLPAALGTRWLAFPDVKVISTEKISKKTYSLILFSPVSFFFFL